MKKDHLSLEYCHVTSSLPWDHEENLREIQMVNNSARRIIKAVSAYQVQKCIMIDDLRSKEAVSEHFIQKIVDELAVKPDVIYLESSFIFAAVKLLQMVNPKIAVIQEKKEEVWLKKTRDHYGSITEFLVRWRNRDGEISFSCPMLVATSYLYRLGALSTLELKPVWGENILQAEKLLNVLPSVYLQVETNAQTIIKATYPTYADNIDWHFLSSKN